MNMIVAVDNNWGIGKNNKLLTQIPGDQKYFREKTIGKVVVLGRKTLESLPHKSPLKDRTNIILTRRTGYYVKDSSIVHSVNSLLKKLSKYKDEDIFVIGGESIYRQLLPYCDTAYVTKIEYTYDADAHFPNLDKDEEWKLVKESNEFTYFDIIYRFLTYKRITKYDKE